MTLRERLTVQSAVVKETLVIAAKSQFGEKMRFGSDECLDCRGSDSMTTKLCQSCFVKESDVFCPARGLGRYRILICTMLLLTVGVGSLVSDIFLEQLPTLYIAQKGNLINHLFVKRGWLWTTAAFSLIFAHVEFWHCRESQTKVWRRGLFWGLLRYSTATFYWFVMTQMVVGKGTSVFDMVHRSRGQCQWVETIDAGLDKLSYEDCSRLGGNWVGFDISGHCFLLIHSILFLMEEGVLLSYLWSILPVGLSHGEVSNHPSIKKGSLHRGVARLSFKALKLLLALLCLLWYQNLSITALYHHHWAEKAAGTFFGLLYWFFAYVAGVHRFLYNLSHA